MNIDKHFKVVETFFYGQLSPGKAIICWCFTYFCIKYHEMVWFLCLMAYQSSWVSWRKSRFIEQQWSYLTYSCKDYGVYSFPKGIGPKVNVIARLEFEIADYDSAPQSFNHWTKRTDDKMCLKQMYHYDMLGVLKML